MLSILPDFQSYPLNRSSLNFSCGAWQIPKSQVYVPVVSFYGEIGSSAEPEEDVFFMKWRSQELWDSLDLKRGLILDLRELSLMNLTNELISKIVPISAVNRGDPIGIIIPSSTQEKLTNIMYSHSYVSEEAGDVFSDIAFSLKKYRLDGGKKMESKPSFSDIRLIPVSLYNSSIEAAYYIYYSMDDRSSFGYLSFKGKYEVGSAGKDDALFLKWRINQFCESAQLRRLLIDIRNLIYEWGDDLSLYPVTKGDVQTRFFIHPEQIANFENEIYRSEMVFNEEEVRSFLS